jgi:Glycine zipper
MRKWLIAAAVVGIAAGLPAGGARAEVFVYPKKDQSQQQFEQDQFQCHGWAKQQTGVDPARPQVATTPTPEQGGGVKGGARGAAVGAVGGAIGGDAGKGAAIGAAVGVAGGAMKQSARNKEAAASAQQAQAQQQTDLQRYEKAYATCMGGRGYQVR